MRILALVMATILAVVSLAACGGGGEEGGTPPAAATPTGTVTATPTAAGTPAAALTPSQVGTPTAEATPSEEALAPGSFSGLNSYRYTMNMDLQGLQSLIGEEMAALPGQDPTALADHLQMEISGAFVAPDKTESHMRISGVDDELALTVIGDQEWVSMGDMAIGPIAAMGDISDLDFASMMWQGFSAEAGGLSCASEKQETVNGVATRYCGIDNATFEQLTALFGGTEETGNVDEMSLEMWLAEDGGWPVRLRVHVAGTDDTGQDYDATLDMDVTDVNSDIDISPPS
jgi:hypothetical protein